MFLVFYRIDDDMCFLVSDTGSEPRIATENHSHIQVMLSFPGLLSGAGFLVEESNSWFVLTADGRIDRPVTPHDLPGGELVGALERLIGLMQRRQRLHRLSSLLLSLVRIKPVLSDKPDDDLLLKAGAVCFDC
ncbi:Uncharacterised protein [Arachnia propionica]|jgi:hypothetical protein|uniref:Uncharacterized protein n=1 Tax=Arachnia propionica TaxID=1750 RepID=A0A448N0A3_9ACTN|nr:Uncharacterised protein [Arachnia propionica]